MASAKKIVTGSGSSQQTTGYIIKNKRGDDVVVRGGQGKPGYGGRVQPSTSGGGSKK